MRRLFGITSASFSGKKIIAGTPLAFGEGDVKSRKKNVIKYKKPAFWVVAAALVMI